LKTPLPTFGPNDAGAVDVEVAPETLAAPLLLARTSPVLGRGAALEALPPLARAMPASNAIKAKTMKIRPRKPLSEAVDRSHLRGMLHHPRKSMPGRTAV
jgi:hypothetical protein